MRERARALKAGLSRAKRFVWCGDSDGPGLSLRSGLWAVDQWGFNAVDYTIVNFRYESGKAILFTSDLASGEAPRPGDLAQRIGERTYSRLVQMVGDPVILVGEDMRLAHVA